MRTWRRRVGAVCVCAGWPTRHIGYRCRMSSRGANGSEVPQVRHPRVSASRLASTIICLACLQPLRHAALVFLPYSSPHRVRPPVPHRLARERAGDGQDFQLHAQRARSRPPLCTARLQCTVSRARSQTRQLGSGPMLLLHPDIIRSWRLRQLLLRSVRPRFWCAAATSRSGTMLVRGARWVVLAVGTLSLRMPSSGSRL